MVTAPTGVDWICEADSTGYAIAGKDYVRWLAGAGVPVHWTPLVADGPRLAPAPPRSWGDPLLDAAHRWAGPCDVSVLHCVPDFQSTFIDVERARGRAVVGYTVWETDQAPAHWASILNRLDGVLVPCRWNVEVLERSGVTVPIRVVPHLPPAVSPSPPAAGGHARPVRRLERRIRAGWLGRPAADDAITVVTIGTCVRRKALDRTVLAFARAFAGREDVRLVVKTGAGDFTVPPTSWRPVWARRRVRRRWIHPSPVASLRAVLAEVDDPPPVAVIAEDGLPAEDIAALHDVGDVYLSLARAEGWGLGAYEAATRGTPVVMTGHGGQLDFLDADLAHLVRWTPERAWEAVWDVGYSVEDRWAEPDVDHAAQLLSEVVDDLTTARERASVLAGRLAERFAPDRVGAGLLQALAEMRT